jgi:hypothetical protein
MWSHSPTVSFARAGSVIWQNIPASTANLDVEIAQFGILPGESVLYHWATNRANGATTVAHAGLTPTPTLGVANTGNTVSQGFVLVHYPLGLSVNTFVTFSKANFWGTWCTLSAWRFTNVLYIANALALNGNVVANTPIGTGFGFTSGTVFRPGYKKSIAVFATSVATGTSLTLTGVGNGYTALAQYSNTNLSVTWQARHWPISLPETKDTVAWAFNASRTDTNFAIIRLVI